MSKEVKEAQQVDKIIEQLEQIEKSWDKKLNDFQQELKQSIKEIKEEI